MERRKSEPSLASYMFWHRITGGITGIFWAVLMLATNTDGLGLLISHSSQPAINLIIFLIGWALTFQPIAVAVGCLASDGDT